MFFNDNSEEVNVFKGNIMEVIFVHLNVRIPLINPFGISELPLCENHQSMGPGTAQDSEMNGMLHFKRAHINNS